MPPHFGRAADHGTWLQPARLAVDGVGAMTDLDLLVLGGGTAGLVAAVIAGGLRRQVTLVQRDRTGGDCLRTGCVPAGH